MRRLLPALIALSTAALILLSALAAPQQADCSSQPCTYLPLVQVPIPTPTTAPPTVVVLPNHAAYLNGRALWIVGEVFNKTSTPVTSVQVHASLLDAQLRQTATTSTTVTLYSLLPGEKTCFQLFFSDVSTWSSYVFAPVTYQTTSHVPPPFTVRDILGTEESDGYHLTGNIHNDAAVSVDSVLVTSTLYDPFGTVLGCAFGAPDDATLRARQTSRFELIFSGGRSYATVGMIRVQADGDIQVNR